MAPSSIIFISSLHLLMLTMFMHPLSTTAQTLQNITLGSALTPLNRTSWILSPSGDFAFGFQPIPSNAPNFLLAVWFDKTANDTIVWHATDNNHNAVLCQSGFSLQLTTDGQFSLKDGNGQEVWNPYASSASYASLLDTGNLILASSDGTPQWRSFDYPTDTLLPSQSLELKSQLTAHLMDADYSRGRFKLCMQGDGNLVFYFQSTLTANQYSPYWASNTVGNGTQLVFNESGTNIYLVKKDNTQLGFTSAGVSPSRNFYQRGALDPDGVFRHYVHPKIGGSNQGWTVAAAIPSICGQNTDTGSGTCGFNSYCNSGVSSVNQTIDCECPPRYSFLDPSRKYKGCQPDFDPQSCKTNESAQFEMQTMVSIDWPLADYEQNTGFSEDQCKSDCLSDCFCAVSILRREDGSCWKKKLPLTNGVMGRSVERVAFIKVRTGNSTILPQPQSPTSTVVEKKRVPAGWMAAGSSILGTSLLVNVALVAAVILLTTCASKKMKHQLRPEGAAGVGLTLRCFTYQELEEATDGFSQEVGSGAFGRVYKGQLKSENGVFVAIKRLDKLLPENEKEFDNEIKSIGQTHHKNLVRLLGFCNEGTERILVYEFMSNGSLMSFLFDRERPDWNRRIQIVMGIARGLLYLHEECAVPIIHCDIKLQNILMDDHLVAKIADFGLAKLLKADQTRTMTGIRGTRGYVAPEWFRAIPVTAKVDVYSFGVMLLEIICCRKNVEQEANDGEDAILTDWAYDCYRDGKAEWLVKDDEEALADLNRVERFVAVAIWCIQEEPSLRPSMQKVTQMLDGSVTMTPPPDPSSYSSIQHLLSR